MFRRERGGRLAGRAKLVSPVTRTSPVHFAHSPAPQFGRNQTVKWSQSVQSRPSRSRVRPRARCLPALLPAGQQECRQATRHCVIATETTIKTRAVQQEGYSGLRIADPWRLACQVLLGCGPATAHDQHLCMLPAFPNADEPDRKVAGTHTKATGVTGVAKRGKHRALPRSQPSGAALCTPCDHFTAWFRPFCGARRVCKVDG